MQFDDIKTETLNLRVSPTFKAALKALADAEHRSMVNMLETLVLERAKAVASLSLGDLTQFGNGRQLGAWLGLVPRQHSSGGKQRLGRITKRGDAYLRKLLVLGARSALTVAPRHDDADARWAVQVRERIGWPKACVALANRNARTLWRTLARRNSAGAEGDDSWRRLLASGIASQVALRWQGHHRGAVRARFRGGRRNAATIYVLSRTDRFSIADLQEEQRRFVRGQR